MADAYIANYITQFFGQIPNKSDFLTKKANTNPTSTEQSIFNSNNVLFSVQKTVGKIMFNYIDLIKYFSYPNFVSSSDPNWFTVDTSNMTPTEASIILAQIQAKGYTTQNISNGFQISLT